MTDQAQRRGTASETGPERGVVTVGLVATPPDHPARVAERLTRELPGLLADRVDRDVRWEVHSGWGAVTPRRDGGADALLDDVARRREGCGWDLAICLTDLPLHAQRVPQSGTPSACATTSRWPGSSARWRRSAAPSGPASRTRRTCVLRPTATTRRRAGGATSRTRNRTTGDRPAPRPATARSDSPASSEWQLVAPGETGVLQRRVHAV